MGSQDRWPLHNSLWVRAGLRTHAYQAGQITELLKHSNLKNKTKKSWGGEMGRSSLIDQTLLYVRPPLMQAQDCQICLPALTPKPRHPECVKFSDLIVYVVNMFSQWTTILHFVLYGLMLSSSY